MPETETVSQVGVWTKESCLDPHLRYSNITRRAWSIMRQEKIPFKDAMRKAWDEATEECRKLGVEIRG